jgi:hypothetical protein
MFRLWGKIIKNNRIVSDQVFEDNMTGLRLEDKLDQGLEALCYHFDIQKPMWFDDHSSDLNLVGKTSFKADHFIENIDFDYLEIEIIENKK